MGVEWVNIGTGETRSHNPGIINGPRDAVPGIYNNGQNANNWTSRWVPDPTPPSAHAGSVHVANTTRPLTDAERARLGKLLLWLFAAVVLVFGVARSITAIDHSVNPVPTLAGTNSIYTAQQIDKYYSLPWNKGTFVQLVGRNVIVTGTIRGASILAEGNITMQGDLFKTGIVAHNGTITVMNVTGSTLTAYDIVVKGSATNTHQYIEGYYFSHGKKTDRRRRPLPR